MARTPLIRQLHAKVRQKLSRREFLFGLGATATATLLPFRVNALGVRVGILGGGSAGLAAALTLKRSGIPFRLIEASNRLGGRVRTAGNWSGNGQFIELGGELLNTTDTETLDLARDLANEQARAQQAGRKFSPQDLRILRFQDGESDPNLTSALIFSKGRVYTDKDLLEGVSALMPKVAEIKTAAFGDFDETYTYRMAKQHPKIAAMDRMTLAELFEGLKSDAEPWVIETLLAAYEAEYGIAAPEMSALNFLTMIDTDLSDGFAIYGESDEALRLGGGNSALVNAVVNSLTDYGRKSLHESVSNGQALRAVRPRASGFRCYFNSGSPETFTHLIVAVPLTQLRAIDGWEKLNLSPAKLDLIRNLAMGQNSKTMMEFTSRFWRDPRQEGPPATQGEVYLSGSSGVIWETSRLQPGVHGILTHYSTGPHARPTDHHGARMYDQLESVYGGANFTQTGRVAHFNWPAHPWTKGSFSSLKAGQYSAFWGAGAEAELKGRLVFAGEHTSEKSQGFINGGYESGLRAAQQVIQVLRP